MGGWVVLWGVARAQALSAALLPPKLPQNEAPTSATPSSTLCRSLTLSDGYGSAAASNAAGASCSHVSSPTRACFFVFCLFVCWFCCVVGGSGRERGLFGGLALFGGCRRQRPPPHAQTAAQQRTRCRPAARSCANKLSSPTRVAEKLSPTSRNVGRPPFCLFVVCACVCAFDPGANERERRRAKHCSERRP